MLSANSFVLLNLVHKFDDSSITRPQHCATTEIKHQLVCTGEKDKMAYLFAIGDLIGKWQSESSHDQTGTHADGEDTLDHARTAVRRRDLFLRVRANGLVVGDDRPSGQSQQRRRAPLPATAQEA